MGPRVGPHGVPWSPGWGPMEPRAQGLLGPMGLRGPIKIKPETVGQWPGLGSMRPKEYKYLLLDLILLDSPGMNEHPIRDTETKVVPIESL